MAEVVEAFMRRHDVPGVGVAIADGDRVAYDRAFGLADRPAGVPLETGHRFRIASVSKPITATAVFRLVQADRLRLDEPVFGRGAVLGDAYGELAAGSALGAVTVDHLLTHAAGGWSNERDDPMSRHRGLDHADLIRWTLAHRPLDHAPGSRFVYSNFGYCLLGRVIEKRSRRSYEAFVREEVLARAGIADMVIAGNGLGGRRADEVRYHAPGTEDPYAANVRRMDSHGGWLARASDVARFAAALRDASSSRILEPASLRAMLAPSVADPTYARGWSVNAKGTAWHMGSLPGTSTIVVRTRGRLSWAILTNASQRDPERRQALRRDLDRMGWHLVGSVDRWRAGGGAQAARA